MKTLWLTTVDNPWDPRDEFQNWLQFDIAHGYKTCEKIDDEAHTASDLSNADNGYYVQNAILKIAEEHPYMYKVIEKDN